MIKINLDIVKTLKTTEAKKAYMIYLSFYGSNHVSLGDIQDRYNMDPYTLKRILNKSELFSKSSQDNIWYRKSVARYSKHAGVDIRPSNVFIIDREHVKDYSHFKATMYLCLAGITSSEDGQWLCRDELRALTGVKSKTTMIKYERLLGVKRRFVYCQDGWHGDDLDNPQMPNVYQSSIVDPKNKTERSELHLIASGKDCSVILGSLDDLSHVGSCEGKKYLMQDIVGNGHVLFVLPTC